MKCNLRIAALLMAMAAGERSAGAAEITSLDGYDIRWDNDLRYSAGWRLDAADPVALNYPNSDDGDRDFGRGLVSSRFDLTSVLDVSSEALGFQFSLDAWYDTVYQTRTDNNSPTSYNPVSVPNSQFAHAVKNLNGQHVDIGDSFAYGNFTVSGMPLSLRLGRQTLLWGESLFFSDNGIAAVQAPVDYIKRTSTPEGYSKDVFLPVNQLSLTLQPAPDLSLAAYYQFEWRPSRLPGVGSYFSTRDIMGAGSERAFLSQGQFLLHGQDREPPAGGQFGIALRKTIDDLDLGFYAMRFSAKYPVLMVDPVTPLPSGFAGHFESVYPIGMDLYGASFSTYLGDSTIAGEISTRRHIPLVSILPVSFTFAAPLHNVGYAEGNTLHGQVSAVTTLAPNLLWDSADLSVEITANDRLGITRNASAFDMGRTPFAASVRGLFEPHYFQVLPNLDVTPVLGASFNLSGRSSTDYNENAGTGDLELGISATYLTMWKADLILTSFVGAPYRQPLSDRDFLMLSLDRAF